MNYSKWLMLTLFILLAAGCSGGGGDGTSETYTGDIQGPGTVQEGKSVEFSLGREVSTTGLSCQWAVDPSLIGSFSNQGVSVVTFTAANVTEDTAAKIRVVITRENVNPMVLSRDIVIREQSSKPSPNEDPSSLNQPPEAVAHAEPRMIHPGQEIQFFDHSTDPDGPDDIVLWEWDVSFDPSVGFQVDYQEQMPMVTFSEIGDWLVQLRVTDTDGNTDMLDVRLSITVTTGALDPVARAVSSPLKQIVCEPVQFQNNGSYSPDGRTIVSYEWDWDSDGTYDQEGLFAEHTWYEMGTYQVQFRATDELGATCELQVPLEVEIQNSLPVAIAEVSRTTCKVGEYVYFRAYDSYDTDCNGGIIHHEWDFENDGVFDIDDDYFSHQFSEYGIYHVQLRVTDDEGETVTLEELIEITVQPGIAITWGGTGEDCGSGIATDSSGNVYVTGSGNGTVDFDPSILVSEHDLDRDAFLSKFNPDGEFLWVRCFEGDGSMAKGVAVDSSDNVYVTGNFNGSVDFDPGSLTDVRQGNSDCFLTRFSQDGEYQWTRTWGGMNGDGSLGIAVTHAGNVYVTGRFLADIDFGSGLDPLTSNGDFDAYICKFNSSGVPLWARSWGDISADQGYGIASDNVGNAYVTGSYQGTVDFDPGPGTDEQISDGLNTFLVKFEPFGGFCWARTWTADEGYGVTTDSQNNVMVTGYFEDTADFDPGPDEDNYDDEGCYVIKFNSMGVRAWARIWGPAVIPGCGDPGYGITTGPDDHIYVTGSFEGTVDFYPGSGTYYGTGGGAYLSEFNSQGGFIQGRTWGESDSDTDTGWAVAVDNQGAVYVTGEFYNTADFNSNYNYDEDHTSNGMSDVFLCMF